MNKLTISDGGYVLVRDWDGNVLEGESSNLLGVFDTDTITVLDQAYNRKPIAILNCLYTDIELNGTTYGSLTELEGAFNEAIEKSEGGGSKVEIVDELPETGEDGVFYVISGSKSVYLYTESEGYVVIEDNTGNGMYVLEVDDYTGQVRLDGETVDFNVVESLFTNNPGKVVMKARYMNGTFILQPLYTIDKFYFFGNFTDETNLGVLTYILDKGASIVRIKLLAPEMLSNKAESIMEEYDVSQAQMFPTIYAVLNFVYGQGYAKWLQVDELPTEGRNIDKNVYVIRTDDDFDFYKMLRNSHGSPLWYKIGSSKTMEQAVLYYDGESNTIKDEAGSVLTMEQIVNLVKDKTKFVYLRDDAVLCLPSLDFYEDAFEFTGTYVMNGYTTTARVIINSNNEVSEYHLTNEKTENKVTTLDNADDETYPTTNAVKTYVDELINARVWTGTMKQYKALSSINPNTVYNVMPNPDMRLKFTAVDPNSSVSYTGTNPATYNWEYSTNGKTWQSYVSGNVISLANAGDYVMFRGNGCAAGTTDKHFNMTGKVAASGSVMSLIDGVGESVDMSGNSFSYLFYYCSSLTTAPELPATTLSTGCYRNMFYNCSSLTTAPELPATTLARECYSYMFQGCTSLTAAPVLPATLLSYSCYLGMFSDCTSLTVAPELPATTTINNCYSAMFARCSKLNSVTTYVDRYVGNNQAYWLSDAAPTGVFRCKRSANIPLNNDSGVPRGWTVEYID